MRDSPRLTGSDVAPDFTIQHYPTLSPDITNLVAIDRLGRIRAYLALPATQVTEEDERWLLARAQRMEPPAPRPDLKLA